jgi:hypothetical protein
MAGFGTYKGKILMMNRSFNIVTNPDGLVFSIDPSDTNSYTDGDNTLYDLSINNNQGTLINGTSFDSVDGGGSLLFDGTNDEIVFNTVNGNVIGYGESEFTVSMWLKHNSFGDQKGWFSRVVDGFSRFTFKTTFANGYDGIMISFGDGVNQTYYLWNDSLTLNTWHNVVVVYENSTFTVYVDGIDLGSLSTFPTTADLSSAPIVLGRDTLATGTRYFDGKMGIVKVYNNAKTSTFITDEFNNTKSKYEL